ncbi:MAG: hypothetical protein CFH41_00861 [Alphaproteobacteria bacterium MarineAlpha11_Bin1]|nr:MAG: hypothetical protein CFH41_00861 [Alphaproteobacteria bacterium MarineAlpha11_Bin1]
MALCTYRAGPEVLYISATNALGIAAVTSLAIKTCMGRGKRQPTTLSTLFAGLRYVYAKKIIFGAITLALLVLLLGGATALFPVFAKDILETGAAGAGFLRSAMAGGAMIKRYRADPDRTRTQCRAQNVRKRVDF